MSRMVSARQLIGRTIVGFEPRPFPAGSKAMSAPTAHDPVIILDNGQRLLFRTEETEVGRYGTCILITPKDAK